LLSAVEHHRLQLDQESRHRRIETSVAGQGRFAGRRAATLQVWRSGRGSEAALPINGPETVAEVAESMLLQYLAKDYVHLTEFSTEHILRPATISAPSSISGSNCGPRRPEPFARTIPGGCRQL
jgi:hypothetical protein